MPAPIPGRVSTQVRIDETSWQKLKIIARLENRNANAQLNHFLAKAIEQYEKQHGVVTLEQQE